MANDETKEITYSLDREKAIVVYLYLATKFNNCRKPITFTKFEKTWDDLFNPHAKDHRRHRNKQPDKKQKSEFGFVKSNFASMSLDEIKEYRDKFKIYDGTTVPQELRRLAMERDVFIVLAPTTEENLSGFDIQVKDKRSNQIYSLIETPYTLTEEAAKQKLESFPTKSELKTKERLLKRLLESDAPTEEKKEAVRRYKAPYATHDFKKFMNQYTLHECNNQQLTLFCVQLCKRVGIENMSNNKPIEYHFCEGSEKRAKTMKRIKNAKKQRKKARK